MEFERGWVLEANIWAPLFASAVGPHGNLPLCFPPEAKNIPRAHSPAIRSAGSLQGLGKAASSHKTKL